MKKLSKIFAVALVLAMALSILPFGAAAASNWTQVTDLSTLVATDMVAITSTKDGATYAMLNNDTKGPLTAFNSASTEATQAMLWNIVAVSGGYKIKVMDKANEWLYCINDNNGIRIGNTETGSVWSTTNYGFLKAKDSGNNIRNFGIYFNGSTATNFRCYKEYTGGSAPTANNALSGQTIKFWKWTGAKPGAAPDTRVDLPTNAGEIVDAIFELQSGEALSKYYKYDGDITLTGVVAGSATWSTQYNNGTVNFKVKDSSGAEKTLQAFRFNAGTGITVEAIEGLTTGDIITVKGSVIKNFSGTFEFDAGCVLVNIEKAQVQLPALPTDVADIVDAIYDLDSNETLDMYYETEEFTLSGVVVGDVTWDESYHNGQLTIKVDGTDKELMAYRYTAGTLGEEVAAGLAAGDKVTFTADEAKNYNGTFELIKPVLTAVEKNSTPAPGGDTDDSDDTGDSTSLALMVAVMALSLFGMVAVVTNKKTV